MNQEDREEVKKMINESLDSKISKYFYSNLNSEEKEAAKIIIHRHMAWQKRVDKIKTTMLGTVTLAVTGYVVSHLSEIGAKVIAIVSAIWQFITK